MISKSYTAMLGTDEAQQSSTADIGIDNDTGHTELDADTVAVNGSMSSKKEVPLGLGRDAVLLPWIIEVPAVAHIAQSLLAAPGCESRQSSVCAARELA